ncbi:acyl CoA binding protein [Ostertagia ostertagi]
MISRYSSSLYSLCRSAYIPMRTFASNQELFEKAQANVKTLTEEPDVDVKLQMYALFKQATVGDVQGSRPGMMDFAGRAKFDAWTKVKGISKEEAQAKYAKIVESLLGEQSPPPAAGSAPMGLKPVEGLDSTFHTPFSTLGQSPEGASSYTFPILMGQLRASEFLILNKKFSAHQALEAGLVNEVVPHDEFQAKAAAVGQAALIPSSRKLTGQ